MDAGKDKVRVAVMTEDLRIEGEMHVIAGSRQTAAAGSDGEEFVVVTDARAWDLRGGTLLYETSCMAIHRGAIDALFPIPIDR